MLAEAEMDIDHLFDDEMAEEALNASLGALMEAPLVQDAMASLPKLPDSGYSMVVDPPSVVRYMVLTRRSLLMMTHVITSAGSCMRY